MSAPHTQNLYGRKACLAAYLFRPQDIVRIYYAREQAEQLGAMLRWAASARIVSRQLDEEGLRRVAKSAHHEGLVLAIRPLRYLPFEPAPAGATGAAQPPAGREAPQAGREAPQAGREAPQAGREAPQAGREAPQARLLALDGVENPHNLGAILRTCAFFGVEGLLAGGVAAGSKVNSAALRVAEGGAEYVRLLAAPELAPVLEGLRREGLRVIGLETGAAPLSAAEAGEGGWVLVAGHERDGLSPAVRRACGAVHAILGAGRLDSLNVSVAVGVALGQLLGEGRPTRGLSPPAGGKQPGGKGRGGKRKR